MRVDDKLTTIEVPGLAAALLAKPVTVRVRLSPRTGGEREIEVRLPDERCGLLLKAFALATSFGWKRHRGRVAAA